MSDLSLDDLFAAAMRAKRADDAATAKRPAAKKLLPVTEKVEPSALYTNPDNWQRGRGIALIHDETNTVLGTFVEYTHKTEKATRRLVKEDSPITVAATERVTGDWWVAEHHEITPPQDHHERRTVILPLILDKLGVHAPLVEVVAMLSYGMTARVELAEDTMFAQLEAAEGLFFLPAGADILPVMARDCKIHLKLELDRL